MNELVRTEIRRSNNPGGISVLPRDGNAAEHLIDCIARSALVEWYKFAAINRRT